MYGSGRQGFRTFVLALGLLVVTGLAVGACASSGERGGGTQTRIITAEQLYDSEAPNVLEAIQRTRPHWLQIRGDRSLGALGTRILVYYNGSRMGTPQDVLATMPIEGIHHIRRADSSEAAQLPGAGIGHVESAILIFTRPER